MNTKATKLVRAKSNGKQFLSPEHQQKTQTSSQNMIKKQEAKQTSGIKIKVDSPKKISSKLESLHTQSKDKHQSKAQSDSSSSLSGSELEREDLLKMEIKQLKRENLFLRKKIQEMTQDYQTNNQPQRKKTFVNKKPEQKSAAESLHLNITYFFKQIGGLLNSVGKLFSLEVPSIQTNSNPDFEHCECPAEKFNLFKKHSLDKKLQKILLEEEAFKYPLLLDLFHDYYRFKEEAEQRIMSRLQEMILKTNQLNKWLIEKVNTKKMKSDTYSMSQKGSIISHSKDINLDFLKTPETNQTTPRSTFSPNNKLNSASKKRIDHSPK